MDNQSVKTPQTLGVAFCVMALVGGIMALFTSIMPLLLAHLLPGLIIIVCAFIFFLWRGAGKGAKITLAIICLILGLWLVLNMVLQLVLPATETIFDQVKAAFLLYFGGVGGFITLIGSILGIMSATGSAAK